MYLEDILKEINFKSQIDRNIEILGIHTLQEAKENDISFLTDTKYLETLKKTKAGAVFLKKEFAPLLPSSSIALITDEPYLQIAYTSKLFALKLSNENHTPKIDKSCSIASNVTFGKDVILGKDITIMANSFIGDNVKIEDNTFIYPNVTIYHNTKIGKNSIIHSGAVIGSDGYGFAHTKMGEHIKIYQNGNVILEDDIEIGANTTIDRAVFGSTIIQSGTKLDNLIQIAHNCNIGKNSLLASQVGLAGSTILGKNVVMGGQSATAGHLKIEDFTTVAGRGGVTKSLKGGKTYGGFPAIEQSSWLKLQAILSRLLKSKKV